MHTGFFDMFENTGHHNLIAVAQHIDIQFGGVAQIAVNQNRAVTRYNHRFAHIAVKLGVAGDNFHRPSAQHVRRPYDDWKADIGGNGVGFFGAARNAIGGLFQAKPVEQVFEAIAVFCQVDSVR